jgi:hypothetical protein
MIGSKIAHFEIRMTRMTWALSFLVTGILSVRVLGQTGPSRPPVIDAILTADFLTTDDKADILCRNAARFLRLDASVCLP